MAIVLRPAVPDDALAVARVHCRAWQIGYRGWLPDAYLDALRPEERAARYTFADTSPARPQTIVALDGDVVCGFATTGPAPDGAGELLALHVDPDYWRRGIGTALITAARARLVGDGHARAVVWVLDGNDRADHFYRGDGWSLDGETRTDTVWRMTVAERRYARDL